MPRYRDPTSWAYLTDEDLHAVVQTVPTFGLNYPRPHLTPTARAHQERARQAVKQLAETKRAERCTEKRMTR